MVVCKAQDQERQQIFPEKRWVSVRHQPALQRGQTAMPGDSKWDTLSSLSGQRDLLISSVEAGCKVGTELPCTWQDFTVGG